MVLAVPVLLIRAPPPAGLLLAVLDARADASPIHQHGEPDAQQHGDLCDRRRSRVARPRADDRLTGSGLWPRRRRALRARPLAPGEPAARSAYSAGGPPSR